MINVSSQGEDPKKYAKFCGILGILVALGCAKQIEGNDRLKALSKVRNFTFKEEDLKETVMEKNPNGRRITQITKIRERIENAIKGANDKFKVVSKKRKRDDFDR